MSSSGLDPGIRKKGNQWEVAICRSGQVTYAYFPLCEYEAAGEYKSEAEVLAPDEVLPNEVEFYRHTSVVEAHELSRRSTIRQAVEYFLKSGWVKRSRRPAFQNFIDYQVTGPFAALALSLLTEEAIIAWVSELLDRYAVSSVRRAFEYLNATLTKLKEQSLLRDNLCDKVKFADILKELGIDPITARDKAWKPWETSRVVAVIYHFLCVAEQCAYVLMVFVGLRISEALAVRPCDIDVVNHTLAVSGTKSYAARRILPLPLFVFDFLMAAIELIFAKPYGELSPLELQTRLCLITTDAWRLHFYDAQERCGVPRTDRYWPHALRRWFLDQVDDIEEVDERSVSVWAGHSIQTAILRVGASLVTYKSYVRSVRKNLTRMAELWDEAIVSVHGLIFPDDVRPMELVQPLPAKLTLNQAAARLGETVASLRFMCRDGRLKTAKLTEGTDVFARRAIWVVDESEVEELLAWEQALVEQWASVAELKETYQVPGATILKVARENNGKDRVSVPLFKVHRRGKEQWALERDAFHEKAHLMGIDKVGTVCVLPSFAARELDCNRDEIDWLVRQGRLKVMTLPFDTRGTGWITRASIAVEKTRRAKLLKKDERLLSAEEVAERLSLGKQKVYGMLRSGVLSICRLPDGRLGTPESKVEAILDERKKWVTINEGAGLLGVSRSPVERYIRDGFLVVEEVELVELGRKVRVIAREAVLQLKSLMRNGRLPSRLVRLENGELSDALAEAKGPDDERAA